MVNHISKLQRDKWMSMPNVTPDICRYVDYSNITNFEMNPKMLQYLIGDSDISVTMNVYTHINFVDAKEKLRGMEEFRKVQAEVNVEKETKMIKVV